MNYTIPETKSSSTKTKQSIPSLPPPPPLPRCWVRNNANLSVTNQEIAKFWRQKHVKEEDHLLAAIKAAACIRARNLTENDYKLFEESLNNDGDDDKENKTAAVVDSSKDEKNIELRVGIKDWWTKSKYAYLNQPAMESVDPPKKRTSNYTPNYFSFKPTPLRPTSLGVC